MYKDDTRPFAQILAEDGDRLSKLKEADLLIGDERIVISTIHKAKGRQFDAVILPDAEDVVRSVGSGDAAIHSSDNLIHRAALAYCRAGLMSGESRDLFLEAIGDFIYSRRGELRLDAATILYENGVTTWQNVITGGTSDFDRLAEQQDQTHETTLSAILPLRMHSQEPSVLSVPLC